LTHSTHVKTKVIYSYTAYILSCPWAGSCHGHFNAHKTCIPQEFPGRLHNLW